MEIRPSAWFRRKKIKFREMKHRDEITKASLFCFPRQQVISMPAEYANFCTERIALFDTDSPFHWRGEVRQACGTVEQYLCGLILTYRDCCCCNCWLLLTFLFLSTSIAEGLQHRGIDGGNGKSGGFDEEPHRYHPKGLWLHQWDVVDEMLSTADTHRSASLLLHPLSPFFLLSSFVSLLTRYTSIGLVNI